MNKKHIFRILQVLFPKGGFEAGREESGKTLLHSLTSKKYCGSYAVLTDDRNETNRTRFYPDIITIDGIGYYVCSQWGWNGQGLRGKVLIEKLLQNEYVTGEMRDELERIAAEWEKQEPNPRIGADRERFWLLVANPQYWSFSNLVAGQEENYSIYTENGRPRQIPRNFLLVKPGEKMVCYEAYPIMQVLAFGEITAGADGETIGFRKTRDLPQPVSRERLLQQPVLKPLFENLRGSLHELTEEQYRLIASMADGVAPEELQSLPAPSLGKPYNRVLTGAPGTGKSWLLKTEATCVPAQNMERVTFHPEYSYFDFVGSYKPVMQEGAIAYDFVPGPFSRVLKAALENPSQNYLLIIEELNRARVAAVFGDVFQLLDRGADGGSEYAITPSEDWRRWLNLPPGEKVRIPANVYIWATMNTADQGVYPIDTAFKRRWSFEYMDIDSDEDCVQGQYAEEWLDLRRHVNKLLRDADINEDKLMGPFFLKPTELASVDAFVRAAQCKVLMYLYEDAARHKRKSVFADDYATGGCSALVKGFDSAYRAGGMQAVLAKLFRS